MINKDLDTRFKEAFEKASSMSQSSIPQDVQLRLYAYYKQATFGTVGMINNAQPREDLRNAFKINAWMQISHLSANEAKELYIETVNSINDNII
jgi:acyl-CoA-binding protein